MILLNDYVSPLNSKNANQKLPNETSYIADWFFVQDVKNSGDVIKFELILLFILLI